jgi:hypothetical protein
MLTEGMYVRQSMHAAAVTVSSVFPHALWVERLLPARGRRRDLVEALVDRKTAA